MTNAFRWRLAILLCFMMAVAVLMVWNVQDSWRLITQLERKLTRSHLESFRLAADFQQHLLSLNGAMVRYAARREPAIWADFEKASSRLDLWIDEQKPRLNTVEERALLDQINNIYDIYLSAARRLLGNQQLPMMSGEQFAQLQDFDTQAGRLLKLGTQLGGAHRIAEESFLTGANRSLGKLRVSFLASMMALLALAAGMGWVIYRDQIAPLRTKLVQSQALLEKQERLATLGTLAAGIAHEIRNPLTSIKARLYTLDKHFETPDLAREDAAIIGNEIARLERIVQDVLQFARPSKPELKILEASVPLREVQSLMASSLDNGAVRLVLEEGPKLLIAADTAQLKQVLINLIRNAAEAMDGKGVIMLRARLDQAWLGGKSRDVAVLEVEDSGKGIPAEFQERLFDPFFTTKEAGTGLGLSIAARIVEKHGGALQYQSQIGRGTTFGVVLPLEIQRAGVLEEEHGVGPRNMEPAPRNVTPRAGHS